MALIWNAWCNAVQLPSASMYERSFMHVETVTHTACAAGDFIITGVKGEHYPVKCDIFHMTYEPVEETNGLG